MGTYCAPPIDKLFLYCYERYFMSTFQKSKRFDFIDKFNDTSRYLDDIFTTYNREFAENVPNIYPRQLQLNKANTLEEETSFLDFNLKVIKVSGATARWPFTDSAVPSLLLFLLFKVCRQSRKTFLFLFCFLLFFFLLSYFSLPPPASRDFSVISQPISMKFGMLIVLDVTNRLNIFSSQ